MKNDILKRCVNIEPNSKFTCCLAIGNTAFDTSTIFSFHENISENVIEIKLKIDYKHCNYLEKLEDYYRTRSRGKLSFVWHSGYGYILKQNNYSISHVRNVELPTFEFNKCNDAEVKLELVYDSKNTIYFKDGTENEFLDFNSALNWYKWNLTPFNSYYDISKYKDINYEIEDSKEPTIVVGSRQCGKTTHMLAWCLAKIATEKNVNIWYVTGNKQNLEYIYRQDIKRYFSVCGDNKLSQKVMERVVTNNELNSNLKFVSITQSNILLGIRRDKFPDYVIYDEMAYMDSKHLCEFISELDIKEQCFGKSVKEVCISTPSKKGSIFNFLATINEDRIEIPWYDVPTRLVGYSDMACLPDYDGPYENEWSRGMRELMGDNNFEIEMCCKINDSEEDTCNSTTFKYECEGETQEMNKENVSDTWMEIEDIL